MNDNRNNLSDDAKLSYFMGKVLSSRKDDFKHKYLTALSRLDEAQWKELENTAVLPFPRAEEPEGEGITNEKAQ